MVGTLQKRVINVSFKLNSPSNTGSSTFGSGGNNAVSLAGHRVSVKILKAGAKAASTAQVDIYGMTRSLMDKLCTQGQNPFVPNVKPTSITIEAGDEGKKLSIVFIGTVFQAWAAYNNQPDVSFHIEARAGLFSAVDIAPPTSYAGPTSVDVIMTNLASLMGLSLENNGVDIMLPSSYYYGSPRVQAYKVAQDANIEIAIDLYKLAIWPKGQSRRDKVVKLSPITGLIGYPAYTNQGIVARSLFNPSITFGGTVMVESAFKPANGEWIIFGLDYDLDSMVPKGSWFVNIQAQRRGKAPTIQS